MVSIPAGLRYRNRVVKRLEAAFESRARRVLRTMLRPARRHNLDVFVLQISGFSGVACVD
jgi:hypothetical protein